MRNKVWLIGLLVVVTAAAWGGWRWLRPDSAAPEASGDVPTIVTVQRGPLRAVIEATGPVVAAQDVPIKCRASGTVTQLPFDVSDRVKKGDLVLQLDTDDQDRAVAKARVTLRAAEAQLAQVQQELLVDRQQLKAAHMKAEAHLLAAQARAKEAAAKAERAQRLHTQNIVSQEDLDTATTAVALANADVTLAEAETEEVKAQEANLKLVEQKINVQQASVDESKIDLDLQLQQLQYATVRSPIDGVVAGLVSGKDAAGNDIITRIGTMVQSGIANTTGGTTVLTVSDHSRLLVYANVAESDIGRVRDPQLHPGQPEQRVLLTADGYPDQVFTGRVVRVADQGLINQNVVTFEVRIEVDSPNKELLKPRMTANVEIIVADRKDALLLPVAAFGRHRDTSLPVAPTSGPTPVGVRGQVYVCRPDGAFERRLVTVGASDTRHFEVLDGLKDGDRVALNVAEDSKWQREKLPGEGAKIP